MRFAEDFTLPRLLIAAIAGVVTVFLINIGGVVEGTLFPVMEPLEIANGRPYRALETRTAWEGRAIKNRNCAFVRLEWYLGPRDGLRTQVESTFTDPPQIRRAGELIWTGLVVGLDRERVLTYSHADVLHRCPLRPWLTRTQFYQSRPDRGRTAPPQVTQHSTD